MEVTLYGIIFIAYVIYVFFRYHNVKKIFCEMLILGIFLYLNITIGYVAKVGSQTIAGYFLATLFAGACASTKIKKMSLRNFRTALMLVACILLSVLLIPMMKYQVVDSNGWDWYLFGANNIATLNFGYEQIKELVKAVAFIFILCAIPEWLRIEDWKYIINKVEKPTKMVLLYGMGEFFVVYILKYQHIYTTILEPIFGLKESTYTVALARGNGYQLQGLTTEPSAYGRCLFLIVLLLAVQMKLYNKKKNVIWIFICIFLMMASMSFISIVLIFLLLAFLILYKYKEEKKRITGLPILIMIGVMLAILVIMTNAQSYYLIRLKNICTILWKALTNSNFGSFYTDLAGIVSDGSSISRLGSAIGILKTEFVQNPFIGLGISSGNAYALLPNILTELGLIGTVLWFKVLINGFREKVTRYFYYSILIMAVFSLFFSPMTYLGLDVIVFIFFSTYIYGRHNE